MAKLSTRNYDDIPRNSKLIFLLNGDEPEEELVHMEVNRHWYWFNYDKDVRPRKRPNLINALSTKGKAGRLAKQDLLFKIYWNYRRLHKQIIPLDLIHHNLWNTPSGYILLQYVTQRKLADLCQTLVESGLGDLEKLEKTKRRALREMDRYFSLSQKRKEHLASEELLPSVTDWCFQEKALSETDYDDQLEELTLRKASHECLNVAFCEEPPAQQISNIAISKSEFVILTFLLLLNIALSLFTILLG